MVNTRGFTLIELMVVVAILAILLTVAVPNFGPFVQESRMDSIQNKLVASLSQARSEAIRQGVDVTLCQRNTTENMADYDCGNDWANGWVTVINDAVVRVEDAMPDSITLTGTAVTFESSGQISGSSSLCFAVTDGDTDTDVRNIQISQFGRIKAWDWESACAWTTP